MNKNTEEKSLIVIKETSVFGKIIRFFQNIFGGKKQTYQYVEENIIDNQNEQKSSFMALDNIELKFQNFREGLIREKDLTKVEREKMVRYVPTKNTNRRARNKSFKKGNYKTKSRISKNKLNMLTNIVGRLMGAHARFF